MLHALLQEVMKRNRLEAQGAGRETKKTGILFRAGM